MGGGRDVSRRCGSSMPILAGKEKGRKKFFTGNLPKVNNGKEKQTNAMIIHMHQQSWDEACDHVPLNQKQGPSETGVWDSRKGF